MQKVFLDTNIVLDFLDKKRPNYKKSIQLISMLIKNKTEIYISEDMLSTIFYISKDKEKVLLFFEMICQKWFVVEYGRELIAKAVSVCLANKGQDLEDTLQCLCAKKNDCTFVITSDKGFVDCGVKVVDYDAFLER